MTLLSPWGMLGLVSVPLILLLYILKQKREKVAVSSLLLWKQVLADMQAKTPWQKLRKNLLLFLQILTALLIVLALSGLAAKSSNHAGESFIIAVDASLSMSSTDVKPTRIEAAKEEALQYCDALPKDSRVTVVRLGQEAEVLLYGADSKEEIRKTIQSIEPSFTYMDIARAEELLLSLKKQDANTVVALFGDMPISVGNGNMAFSNYKRESNNVSVILFTHTRSGNQITGMSTLRNQGDVDREVSVSLYVDDVFYDSQRIRVPKEETQTIWWKEIPATASCLHCVIDTEDILEADNHAYDAVLSGESVKVLLVTQGNLFLEKVLSLMEGIELTRTRPEDLSLYQGFDLYILDGTVPEKLPEDGNVIVFAPEPNELFPVGDWMDTPKVEITDHAIFQYIEKAGFSIGRTRIMEKPEWAEIVMEYNQNPIVFDGLVQNTRVLVFGFHLYETDLPLRTEFPVLMANIVSEYAPEKGTHLTGMIIGDSAQFLLQPDTTNAEVILPDGQSVAIAPPVPPEPFIATNQPGIYRLLQKNASQTFESLFTVNLPDEWFLENRETGTVMPEESAGTHIPLQKRGQLFNTPLLIAAILILLLEWWYYANRNYV